MKARYEEAKIRDLEPRSNMGNQRLPVSREDVSTQPRNLPNQSNPHVGAGCASKWGM